MPLLAPQDALPCAPRRVLVAGTPGAGKSTLARSVAQAFGLAHHELDALFHGRQWRPRPQFHTDVEAFSRAAAWVAEWQYEQVKPLLAERADLMLWLDLPRRTVMRQVLVRTVRRSVLREELWNGNREAALHTFFTDPDHIVRWAWRIHHRHRGEVLDVARTRLPVIRLTSHAQARGWVRSFSQDRR